MGDRLTFDHNRHGPKEGTAVPISGGGRLDPHLTQCGLSRGLSPYTKWHLDLSSGLATTHMGRNSPKSVGVVPLRGAGSPSHTTWLRPRPTSIPSGILIHPAVWTQQTSAKNWGTVPLCGELDRHLTQCRMGRGLSPYQVAS